ncbi:glycosyltransferase family 4 protein [Arthrobacter sp. StoSoilB5]|uniref:glycosyltransferase family 4 protein n=1 Tax=Arthrobacter sp. StoSoilB5 TaxID=2830992 RepID=UPI001CC7E519|nr:glycosyltransferase family 4 protein [Arthrobacter sp. StoSoilB5]
MVSTPKANLVYWYGLDEMPEDGGGLRAIAWYKALNELGFETTIHRLRSVGSGVQNLSYLRSLKKALVPMPLETRLDGLTSAELNVITVPSVFRSAARTLPLSSLVFDWMDLWSVNARTMGQSSFVSRPGGLIQSNFWSSRQRTLVRLPMANTFAGFDDRSSMGAGMDGLNYWIPTPISAPTLARKYPSAGRTRVGFIGNFAYPPNVMSLRSFFTKFNSNILDHQVEIVVAGFGSEVVKQWNVPATVVGHVASLSDFYNSIDAAIVPIDHGGGIKAKAVEAMAYGVPIFGTPHVSSGFAPEWAPYISGLENLFVNPTIFPPSPPRDEFENQFSQMAFTDTVRQMLVSAGKL